MINTSKNNIARITLLSCCYTSIPLCSKHRTMARIPSMRVTMGYWIPGMGPQAPRDPCLHPNYRLILAPAASPRGCIPGWQMWVTLAHRHLVHQLY